MTWIQRLKRVIAINIETCPKCGGKLRVNRRALKRGIEDPDVIATILEHIRARDRLRPAARRVAWITVLKPFSRQLAASNSRSGAFSSAGSTSTRQLHTFPYSPIHTKRPFVWPIRPPV
jgi:hypothetical protein